MKIYTRRGDDGTTGLLFGGRVSKDAPVIAANGVVDEAQAALGVARSHSERGSELDLLLISLERDLWVLMAEVACAPGQRARLVAGTSEVTTEMVERLESTIDDLTARTTMPAEFVVPGGSPEAALLDQARTIVRRAERACVEVAEQGSLVGPYLNRLSDLCWTMARFQEGSPLLARGARPPRRGPQDKEDA